MFYKCLYSTTWRRISQNVSYFVWLNKYFSWVYIQRAMFVWYLCWKRRTLSLHESQVMWILINADRHVLYHPETAALVLPLISTCFVTNNDVKGPMSVGNLVGQVARTYDVCLQLGPTRTHDASLFLQMTDKKQLRVRLHFLSFYFSFNCSLFLPHF